VKIDPVATGCIGACGGILSVFIGGWCGCHYAYQDALRHPSDGPTQILGPLAGSAYGAVIGPVVFLVIYLTVLAILSLYRNHERK
jgi:hypothetical protein